MQAEIIRFDHDQWPACWILDMIARNGDCAEFYHSRFWKRLRPQVVKAQHGKCWYHLHPQEIPYLAGQRPAMVTGNTVHHRYPVRQRPDLCLSPTAPDGSVNLVCVCPTCHWHLEHSTPTVYIPERW